MPESRRRNLLVPLLLACVLVAVLGIGWGVRAWMPAIEPETEWPSERARQAKSLADTASTLEKMEKRMAAIEAGEEAASPENKADLQHRIDEARDGVARLTKILQDNAATAKKP